MRTIAVMALLVPSTALAWPSESDWEDLEVSGVSLVDPADDMIEYNSASYLDIVGDATSVDAAGLWYADSTALYFRIRVDQDPSDEDDFSSEGSWVVLIENDGDTSAYEYSIAYTSDGEGTSSIQVYSNATKSGDADDPAENILWETDYDSTGVTETAAISSADSSISLDQDYFIDLTIPWGELETETSFSFSRDVAFQLALATAEYGNAASVNVDLAEAAEMDELSTAWSDAVGIDLDGDGLLYFDEINDYGTDPNDADTDDDGLSDGDEVLVYGTDPTACDSDGDGLSDGLEHGVVTPLDDTDTGGGCFTADADPGSTTDPNNDDTEGDSRPEWLEDVNGNGQVDDWESDPNIYDVDTDGDGIVDFIEDQCEDEAGTSTDQDGDGTADSEEGVDEDGFLIDADGDAIPDFCDPIVGDNSGGDDTGSSGGGDDTDSSGGDDTGSPGSGDDTDSTGGGDDTGSPGGGDDTGNPDDSDDTGMTGQGVELVCSLPFICEGRLTGGSCSTITAAAGFVPVLLTMLAVVRRREDG